MPNPQLSILVVDDAKFSSAIVGRALAQAGYRDLRFASSAAEALSQMSERPASVLLADWLMPEMDGLELTARTRKLDEQAGHYTYVILLTGKEGENVQTQAFDSGVDDFISKTTMNEQLIPRIYAADRLCAMLQSLVKEKKQLTHRLTTLEQYNSVDPLTGLNNKRYLQQKLNQHLKQIESRGGALFYLQISFQHGLMLRQRYGDAIYGELLRSMARRLQQLVRPQDTLARLDMDHFALVILQSGTVECSVNSFKRIHTGLNLKPFRTREGFINLKSGIGMVSCDDKSLPANSDELIERAGKLLNESFVSGRIAAAQLPSKFG